MGTYSAYKGNDNAKSFDGAEMEFLDRHEMIEVYYRNNRTSGQKNLRCFPCCGDKHSESTFCGRPLKTVLRVPRSNDLDLNDVLIIGEFRPFNDESDVSDCVNLSDFGGLYEEEIKVRLKSRTESLHQFYASKESCRAEYLDHWEIASDFNEDCCSWHYGWKGNRYKQSVRHVFMVSVLVREKVPCPIRGHFYKLLGQFCSPSFCVLSLRRRVVSTHDHRLQVQVAISNTSRAAAPVASTNNAPYILYAQPVLRPPTVERFQKLLSRDCPGFLLAKDDHHTISSEDFTIGRVRKDEDFLCPQRSKRIHHNVEHGLDNVIERASTYLALLSQAYEV
eukprot:gene3834-7638_t